jgi:hypothetical protein
MRPAISPISTILNHANGQFLLSLFILITAINISLSGAQSLSGNLQIEEGGQLWIEGSAGIVNFKCEAEQLSGAGNIENTEHPEATVQGQGDVSIAISLPVESLNCGKRAMNNDMYDALKSDNFPSIRYQLIDASLANEVGLESDVSEWLNIRTHGIMEIAGVKDTTLFSVRGKMLSDDRFQVKGSKNIHMDTYDIKPPSKMLGLIKADKNLMVHFDVVVKLINTPSTN